MKKKIVTPQALADIEHVAQWILADRPAAAVHYYQQALQVFEDLPDIVKHRRASPLLPEEIRALNVPDFTGYTLRYVVLGDTVYLLSAFAPKFSDDSKDGRTQDSYRNVISPERGHDGE